MAHYFDAATVALLKAKSKTMMTDTWNDMIDALAAFEDNFSSNGAVTYGTATSIGTKTNGVATTTSRSDHVHDIPAGHVDTTHLADDAVTGVKIDSTAFFAGHFTGRASAGAITLTGAKVNDVVIMLTNLSDSASGAAAFESVITVADEIQQTSASDLHLKKYSVLLLTKS